MNSSGLHAVFYDAILNLVCFWSITSSHLAIMTGCINLKQKKMDHFWMGVKGTVVHRLLCSQQKTFRLLEWGFNKYTWNFHRILSEFKHSVFMWSSISVYESMMDKIDYVSQSTADAPRVQSTSPQQWGLPVETAFISLSPFSLSLLSSAFNSCIRCSLWSLLLNPRDIRGSITPGQSLSGGHWVTIPLCYGDVSLEHRKIDHQFKLPLTFFSPAAV